MKHAREIYITVILLASVLWVGTVCNPAQAGVYVDLGVDWLHNMPAKSRTDVRYEDDTIAVSISQEAEVNIDSPALELGLGYRTKNNYHFEVHRFGVLNDPKRSITVFRFYKRWEWK